MHAQRNNQELLNRLRHGLDLRAVEIEVSRGAITSRQARTLTDIIQAVRDIRENPVYAIVDLGGHYVGEVTAKDGGAAWIGCRYGQSDPLPASEFSSFEAAKLFVCSTDPGDPKTMIEYKRRVVFC